MITKANKGPFKHGMWGTPEYQTWKAIKNRCYNPNNSAYGRYGGRGITVCDRWRDSFLNFYEDMGPKPEGLSIERKDNNGPYSPTNCKWASNAEQAINKRNNRLVTVQGETKVLSVCAREHGLLPSDLGGRLRNGWALDLALSRPVKRRDTTFVVFQGERRSLTAWSRLTGINIATLQSRLRRGWSVEEALTLPPKPTRHYLTIDGQRRTLTEWGNLVGLSRATICTRLSCGWSEKDAVFAARQHERGNGHQS